MEIKINTSEFDKVVDSRGNGLLNNIQQIWSYRDLVFLFIKRDFVVNFKQTILGPLWFLIQPICTTIMHIIVFGGLAKLSTDGIPQILFYFSGSMLWGLFTAIITVEANIFNSNKSVFGKVYFPRLTAVISAALSETLKVLIQFALFLLLYFYYVVYESNVRFSWGIFAFIPIFIWIIVVSTGIGLVISSITTKYRDLAMTLGFFLSLLMYVSPVAYPLSQIAPKYKILFWINPMSAPIECFRKACFGVGTISFWYVCIEIVISMVVFWGGLLLFCKNEKSFVDVI